MAVHGSEKSLSRATSLKEEGNKIFKQGYLDIALKYFTQALFFAPYPTEIIDQKLRELVDSCDPFLRDYLQHDPSLTKVKGIEDPILPHCYGNRSAALYELGRYKECLVDIDRALTSRYPNTTIFKLYKRQALCLAHLGRSDEAISAIEQCKSKVMCSMPKDKVVLETNIQDVMKEIKQIKYNNICPICVNAGYCSVSCMQIAWRSYHWLECKNIDSCVRKSNEAFTPIILAFRMLLKSPRQSIKSLIKKCQTSSLDNVISELTTKECTDINGVYQTVLQLKSHSGQYTDEYHRMGKLIEMLSLSFKTILLGYYDLDSSLLSILIELLKYHMFQVHINVIGVGQNIIHLIHGQLVTNMKKQTLGSAIYLTASLFNHSCNLNMKLSFAGTRLSVRVIESSVGSGKELFICYGADVAIQRKAKRQQELRTRYFFECTCSACHNPDKTLIYRECALDGLACFKCQGLLPLPDTGKISQCLDCGESTDISHHLEIKDQADVLYQEADQAFRSFFPPSALPIFENCYKKQSQVLFKFHDDLIDTCDAISCLYCNFYANYKAAIPYLKQRCDAQELRCGSNSFEFTRALCKLIQALVHSGDKTSTDGLAHQVSPLLKFYYPNCYQDIFDFIFSTK